MKKAAIAFLGLLLSSTHLWAASRSQSALTLIEPTGARIASLGEAGASLTDDITALQYNPALLSSLSTRQISLLFQRGLIDDRYGHLSVGQQGTQWGLGLSVGYYDSGTLDVFDGQKTQTVVGERDIVSGLTLSHRFSNFSLGVTGKHFSSRLAETRTVQTFTSDLGLWAPMAANITGGLAIQNLGGSLENHLGSDPLPRQARAGISCKFQSFSLPALFLSEGIYRFDQKRFDPGLGIEVSAGPLAFRTGYHGGSDVQEFTFGTGFFWGTSSLDYAFGLASQLNSTHRISFTNRFGRSEASSPIVKKREEIPAQALQLKTPVRSVFEITPAGGVSPSARVYFVRPGDTLKSIAMTVYGREEMWEDIYRANQHLLSNPDNFQIGQRILLPARTQ